jgi:hypothetical protein
MGPIFKLRGWLGLACVVAAAGGVAAAMALPASASESISVQGFALPSGSNSIPVMYSMVQGLNGQEWFITSSGDHTYGLGEMTAGGAFTALNAGLPLDATMDQSYPAMISGPDGLVWLVGDLGYNLSGVDSSGNQTVVDGGSNDDHDIVEGPDGKVYVSDNSGSSIDQYVVTGTPSASPPTAFPTSVTPGAVQPDAIASAGGLLWFSDDSGNLYSMTTGGTVTSDTNLSGATVTAGAHTMIGGPDGYLWAISSGGGNPANYGSSVLEINPSNGAVLHTYSTGIPSGAVLTSITVGADGDLWFPEAGGSASAQGIGQLNPSTGTITSYSLPNNLALPIPLTEEGYAIAPGAGNTIWFTATDSSNTSVAAIGEVSGLTPPTTTTVSTTPPAPGTVSIVGTAKVSSKGVAAVGLLCSGSSGATCSGKLTLAVKLKHKVTHHGKTKTVPETKTLGPVSYSANTGKRVTVDVKLSGAALTALDATKNRRLSVTAAVKQTGGPTKTRSVTLIGARPKPKKKK